MKSFITICAADEGGGMEIIMICNVSQNLKKNFGFGFMRLPMNGSKVNYAETCKMVDAFLENGFNYFDTAHGYLNGESEKAIRECLVKRYPRENYLLANKLSTDFFDKKEDIIPLFDTQLEACGVEYFDFYLMHAQNAEFFRKYKKCQAYETAFALKKEGKIKHVGISFHDRSEILDQILTEYPQIEVVQIQFNYIDYEDAAIEARVCYEICVRHNKPVIVMEPVKGGNLITLPKEAQEIFDGLKNGSNASYAIRFAASFDNVVMVLSGMSNIEQMQDNISYMKCFQPLSDVERNAIQKVSEIFKKQKLISCTGCKYCLAGCPQNIMIPALFADMNAKNIYKIGNSDWYYKLHTQESGKASDCIGCGKCENSCPQHLNIRELLSQIAEVFEL